MHFIDFFYLFIDFFNYYYTFGLSKLITEEIKRFKKKQQTIITPRIMKKLLLSLEKKNLFLLLLLLSANSFSQVNFKNQGFESSVADNYSYTGSSSSVTTSTTTSMWSCYL